jgi:hypothetical protein
MFRNAIRLGLVVAALAAPLLTGCFDLHTAEECDKISTCPPDAGDAGDGSLDAGDGDAH